MNVFLKVKVKALASEAKIIRKEERNTLNQARRRRRVGAEDHVDALESRYERLHGHRVGPVRRASRQTHLAYGFLRGLRYEQMERDARTEPDWTAIAKMMKRYGDGKDRDTYPEVLQKCLIPAFKRDFK